ncbi:adenylylsulfate kinase /sulfate adenylyltransferase subunit 1 [Thalassospira xiamenensis M-5 = DSM 17429]|uniref:Multifunctional fusion protein n=1 Tax=Thalassospira xiamenensis M-5 = DSM 17429 TaxID=1123366 RepID=A0AB72UEV2_9PROT|nr:sulfate adenylyltransferase subunit CysN [Thalassospira xiamenensis]AJD52673.1 bifunctional sulfate adenylyltransferase subunit 1/adenylylsulfate kinase protein [Thalassospira xiamenensis M-5 = DSM 17429]SIT29586.1 adenylylsulfate kinase /sulfate adenylyltransferase subunit 1 [Thalassospira xiamenensis M-5 = DSM 17429]
MAHQSDLIADDILGYLKSQEEKSLLRFITCGSVDDGKSTLIGRLLWDSKMIFEDQLAALESDSRKVGTQGGEIDFALLLDGLQAEREQGITIDVAYRFFSTDKRKFIVADTPGHEQYTRNMATGASTADVAVILIDARKGILTQTRRHSFITSLLGIKHVVLAVNKMDLIDYDQDKFDTIVADYKEFAKDLGYSSITPIPLSALRGDNMIEASPNTPWYEGPTLLAHLETVQVEQDAIEKPFRLPVQWVNRPNLDFRGFSGTIASGIIKPGDAIAVTASGQTSKVREIVTFDGNLDQAFAGQAVTITLEDEIDISRGDVLARPDERPEFAGQFEARIIWMHEDHLLPGRPYIIKMGAQVTNAQISDLKYKVNVNTLEHIAGKTLELNEVGIANIATDKALAFDPYDDNRHSGRFIIIDRYSNATVGAGMVNHSLRRATNVKWQEMDINKQARAYQKGQKSAVLWFTGLSGAGKSTIANLVEKRLHAMGKHTYTLDGDNVRHGLNKDLGFTDADRVENIRRVGETAKLFVDAGIITLVSFISPFKSERQFARSLVEDGEFIEVFIDTPIEVCEQRDVKGLYKKAREGKIANFTGIDSPYEAPENAEITVNTSDQTAEQAAEIIVAKLEEFGVLGAWYPEI